MELQTRSSPNATPGAEETHRAVRAEDVRRPGDGSRRRLGLAIVAAVAVATGCAVAVVLYEAGSL